MKCSLVWLTWEKAADWAETQGLTVKSENVFGETLEYPKLALVEDFISQGPTWS